MNQAADEYEPDSSSLVSNIDLDSSNSSKESSEDSSDVASKKSKPRSKIVEWTNSSSYKEFEKAIKTHERLLSTLKSDASKFFDHESRGSDSEAYKLSVKVGFNILKDWSQGKHGEKQRQEIDKWIIGKGSEFWSIIPDLRWVGYCADEQGVAPCISSDEFNYDQDE